MKFKKVLAVVCAALLLSSLFSCKKNEEVQNDGVLDSQETENTEIDNTESEINTEKIPENITQEIIPEQEQKEEEIVIPEAPENPFEGETLESFYASAAFVGDSVMHGLQLYSARGVTATTNSTFLTLSSFAARHALSDVTEKSYHPLYNGEKMKTEDALALSGVDKVFVSLGLNDVRVTPKTYYENYVEFLSKIKEKCPDIKIFIVSTTYPVKSPNPNKMDRATALDYRDQLHDLNTRLYAWCRDNDAYFVDLLSPIMSNEGFLADEYTSDNYVHLTNKAYTIWEQTLIDYANYLIENGYPIDSFPAIPLPEPIITEVQSTEDESASTEITTENTMEVSNEN